MSEMRSHFTNGNKSYVTVMKTTQESQIEASLKPNGFFKNFLNTALPCAWVDNIGNHIDHGVKEHVDGCDYCDE